MRSSLLNRTTKSKRKSLWLFEPCPACGGNLYIFQENGIRSRVKKCLQCSREFSSRIVKKRNDETLLSR